MKYETKLLVCLAILALFDMVIPIPFTTVLLIYVVVEKPLWFKDMATRIYEPSGG